MPHPGGEVPGVPADRRTKKSNAVVNEVRRLLLRLATQLNSHRLDLERLEPRTTIFHPPVDLSDALKHGSREAEACLGVPWILFAPLPRVMMTDLDAGTGPLAPHCTVSDDQARLTHDVAVSMRHVTLTFPAPTLAHPVLELASAVTHGATTQPAGGSVADAALTRLPSCARLFELMTTPPSLPGPGKHAPRHAAPLLATPEIKPVPDRIGSEIALERRRALLPSLDTAAGRTAHLMTRQLLAAAAGGGVSEQDIAIVGVYRRVPISAAATMAFDDQTHALCLYLRPHAARMVQSQGSQVVSLVFGRVLSDGRLVRALVPAPSPANR